MQARIVTPARGAAWLADGWRMFKAAPFGWFALVFAYWLLMTLASVVPVVGVALASAMVPAFSVGFMAAGRAVSARGALELSLLFEGFRHAPRSQAALGAVYVGCLAAVLGVSAALDGGALARGMLAGARPGEETLQSGEFLAALAAAATLYAPVMMMFWFAPPLAAWHGTGPAKALFFSFYGCLLNWRAFLAYGAVTAVIAVGLPFLAVLVLMFATRGASTLPIVSLAFPLLLVLLPTLFASFYASYRDVFGPPAGNERGIMPAQ
ncbi:MAG: BPSS1780 family membrane protein [Betaproteobacteria bacterium]